MAALAANRVAGTEVWMWVIARVTWSIADKLLDTSFELADYNKSKIVDNFRLPFIAPNPAEISTKNALFTPLVLQPADLENGKAFKERFINKSNDIGKVFTSHHEDVNPIFSDFALLDVSSNANQMGIAFSHKLAYMQQLANNGAAIDNENTFPLKIDGVSVTTAGRNAQAFTMPGIAWEPLLNLSFTTNADPLPGFNYFPNDGVPTVMGNLSNDPVTLAPIPLS